MLYRSASPQSLYLIFMGENPTLKTKRKKSNCTKKVQWVFQFHHTAESMTCQLPVLKTSYAKYNHVSVIPRATAEDPKPEWAA